MFHRDARFNWFLCALFFVVMSGCGGVGSGCGCSTQPLPGGKLPADQTIEGGAQVRVTPAGFTKLTSILPSLLNKQFGSGFCVPKGSAIGADYCYKNDGQCGPGCNVHVHLNSLQTTVTTSKRLNIKIDASADTTVTIDPPIFSSCSMAVSIDHIKADLDIAFDINANTGELGIHLDQINSVELNGPHYNGCTPLDWFADVVTSFLNSTLGQFVVKLLTPAIDNIVQGILPHPLGIEGMVDVGGLLAQVSPGTQAEMEMRAVPGGYVELGGGGMSLGMITGFNADWDPSTRTADLDSEPALCVPPIPAPDFSKPPYSLPNVGSPRFNFQLNPAGEFRGSPDPASDLAIGLSQTTLDLVGHHAVTSGAMCLGVGTSFVPQLNLGTIGLLVPSLAELGTADGKDPILLVTRPQRTLSFDIGEGTDTSPALTIHIDDMEVDFYAFIYQRYVRAFTLAMSLNVGVNLEFKQQPGMPATVTPQLVGLEAKNIHITVLNSEFVRETPQQLEAVLPSVFDLALPLLGGALKPITVPSFAGFTLNDLRVQHVTTSQDDFLAIYASLGASQLMRSVGEQDPLMQIAVRDLDRSAGPAAAPVATTQARVVSVDTPDIAVVRAALAGDAGAHLPTVTLDVPARDPQGRELEYTWNLNGGVWRQYVSASPLVIADRAFAWQGKYTIGVRSRVKGDYHTTDAVGTFIPVTIDSVGPVVQQDQIRTADGKVHVPAVDLVSEVSKLQWAFGRVGDKQPWTDWQGSDAIDEASLKDIAADGEFMVFVKDEVGNVSATRLSAPFHGTPGTGGGCTCNSSGESGGPGAGTLLVFAIVGLVMFGRRRSVPRVIESLAAAAPAAASALARHVGRQGGRALPRFFSLSVAWFGIAALSSLVPGCSCGSKPGTQSCEMTEDCAGACPAGQVAICFDHSCECIDDVPTGKTGPYSDVDKASNGDAYVSAYSQELGDLVVARHAGAGRIPLTEWEWVDGVPVGGAVTVPGSLIRGGITDPGPDVGMYTSIAVAANDTPEVAYHDNDTGSLKYAAKVAGAWSNHTVDPGTGKIDPESGGEIAGFYNSIALRSDDGRPGIAYMAEVSEGGGVVRAEVRYASAQTPNPTTAGDWMIQTIDTITLPAMDPNKPDPYPLPEGLGLFLDAARDPTTQAPVVVYYDRVNGDLKMAQLDPQSGVFKAPVVLDGTGNGKDVGWYPSVAVDASGTVHVAYQSATKDDLLYINNKDNTPELIDDGYRIVGVTQDGLPKPEFHIIGNDASLILAPSGPVVAYQDSTSHELLTSTRKQSGEWQRMTIAGGDTNFMGAYGFFAASVLAGTDMVISNWVIDSPNSDNWVEVLRQTLSPQ